MARIRNTSKSTDTSPAAPPPEPSKTTEQPNPAKPTRTPLDNFPQPPARRLDPEDFFAYLDSLPKRAWSQVMVYVYRLWPICIRPKNQRYIDKIAHAFNIQTLTKTHGSGDYKLILTAPSGGMNQPGICETRVDIRNPDYDPILSYDELDLGHPQNKSYVAALRRQGLIPAEAHAPAPPAAAGDNNSTEAINSLAAALIETTRARPNETSAAMKQTLEMLALGHRQAVELALSQIKVSDPNAQILPLLELLLKQQPAGNTTKQLVEMFDLVERIRPRPEPQANPLEQLEQSMALFERFQKIAPHESASGLSWPDVLVKAVEVIAPVLGQVFLALQSARPADAIAQAGALAPQQPAPQPPPPNTATVQGNGIDPQMQQLEMYLPIIRRRVVDAASAGGHGADFAASVVDMFGAEMYQSTAAAGAEKLYQLLVADEQTAALDRAMNNRLRPFVEEFIQYGSEPEPEATPNPQEAAQETTTPEKAKGQKTK